MVLQPGEDVLVQVVVMATPQAVRPAGFAFLAEDASGCQYAVRASTTTLSGPPVIDAEDASSGPGD